MIHSVCLDLKQIEQLGRTYGGRPYLINLMDFVRYSMASAMPRQSRIDTAGALHHIIAHGIERRKIFDDDHDRYDFLKRFALILEQTQTTGFAWSQIPNHLHLLLRTGEPPVATLMRRLLTGHAISYNRRHRRHGHLFQNRYKSILCQEDAYLLELVRYIHLNPLRAGIVKDLDQLEKYTFSGHGVIMGKHEQSWQNSAALSAFFGKRVRSARRNYMAYVAKGIAQGRRNDLTGGGTDPQHGRLGSRKGHAQSQNSRKKR